MRGCEAPVGNMKRTTITLLLAVTAAVTLCAADVPALYEQHCVACHAKDGSGNTKMGRKTGVKDYRDPKVLEAVKDDKALTAVKEGLTEKGQERMKPFKDKLNDEEIKALIGHLKELGKK